MYGASKNVWSSELGGSLLLLRSPQTKKRMVMTAAFSGQLRKCSDAAWAASKAAEECSDVARALSEPGVTAEWAA